MCAKKDLLQWNFVMPESYTHTHTHTSIVVGTMSNILSQLFQCRAYCYGIDVALSCLSSTYWMKQNRANHCHAWILNWYVSVFIYIWRWKNDNNNKWDMKNCIQSHLARLDFSSAYSKRLAKRKIVCVCVVCINTNLKRSSRNQVLLLKWHKQVQSMLGNSIMQEPAFRRWENESKHAYYDEPKKRKKKKKK